MAKIMIAPSKYVQGKDEMKNLGSYIAKLGKSALVLISASGMKRFGDVVTQSLAAEGVSVCFDTFNGECSKNEVNRLIAIVEEKGCDTIIGVGGGKILDTAKAVGYYKDLPVAIVPTIASTDAPCSALTVLYTDEGVFDEYLFLKHNPNLVLVDTQAVVNAPARLLVSGMGDALATYFEARACLASSAGTCAGGTSTLAAMGLAKLCYDTLLDSGLKAKLALESKVCTKAVENIVEANTLLSGIGFESSGLAGAHAIHNGFTVMEECHHLYHGEKVAFGTLVQLMLEDAPMEELVEVVEFCQSVGLPTTLADMGVTTIDNAKIMAVAEAAAAPTDTIHNMPFPVTAEDVYAAILAADAFGHEMK